MKIDQHLLEQLSRLSALHFPEKEKTEILRYLHQTLSHFEKIREIDTQGLEPLISPSPPSGLKRDDKTEDFPDKKLLWEQIPKKRGTWAQAPPVREEQE